MSGKISLRRFVSRKYKKCTRPLNKASEWYEGGQSWMLGVFTVCASFELCIRSIHLPAGDLKQPKLIWPYSRKSCGLWVLFATIRSSEFETEPSRPPINLGLPRIIEFMPGIKWLCCSGWWKGEGVVVSLRPAVLIGQVNRSQLRLACSLRSDCSCLHSSPVFV